MPAANDACLSSASLNRLQICFDWVFSWLGHHHHWQPHHHCPGTYWGTSCLRGAYKFNLAAS